MHPFVLIGTSSRSWSGLVRQSLTTQDKSDHLLDQHSEINILDPLRLNSENIRAVCYNTTKSVSIHVESPVT